MAECAQMACTGNRVDCRVNQQRQRTASRCAQHPLGVHARPNGGPARARSEDGMSARGLRHREHMTCMSNWTQPRPMAKLRTRSGGAGGHGGPPSACAQGTEMCAQVERATVSATTPISGHLVGAGLATHKMPNRPAVERQAVVARPRHRRHRHRGPEKEPRDAVC